MVDPVGAEQLGSVGPLRPTSAPRSTEHAAPGSDFATQLRQQLEQVSQMQADADLSLQSLVTGRSDNITEVFTTARKAEVAFTLLMEIRNKLMDAYSELRQMRV